MKLFKKTLAGVALAAVLATSAQAGVMAIADMEVSGLGFASLGLSTLTILTEIRSGNASATYNGVPQAAAGFGAGNGTVDVPAQCVGNCASAAILYSGGLNNSSTHIGLSPLFNYALGDMLIQGSVIGGAIRGLTRANAVAAGPTNTGSANATILNTGSVSGTFTSGTTFTSALVLAVDAFLRAWVSPTTLGTAVAGAGYGWTMRITGAGFTPLIFSPSDLNRTATAVLAGANDFFSTGGIAHYFSDPRTYTAGTVYSFSINQSSNAQISEISKIPEPASLALFGLGLLALAVSRRRKLL